MSPGNGNFDWEQNLHDLNEAARLNLDDHERIWKSIETLRDSQLMVNQQVSSLVSAIRDLIDRIRPKICADLIPAFRHSLPNPSRR